MKNSRYCNIFIGVRLYNNSHGDVQGDPAAVNYLATLVKAGKV